VSILTLDDGVYEVKAVSGNTHLGGSDFDNIITEHLIKEFVSKNKGSFTREELPDKVIRRIRTQAERAKRILSSTTSANIEIDSLYQGIDFLTTLSRAKFEELCGKQFKDTLQSVEKALTDAKLSKKDIHEIVLVGGSTRIPKVQQILSDYFNGKELCKSINPDEAVAYGAAVQAAVLTGTATGAADAIVLIDVAPLSLGIETGAHGEMAKIIDRNSQIPCKKTQTFTTYSDNQSAVTISIFEGERSFTKDNNLLGRFNLEGIPPARRGVPQIEVSFDLNCNGILSVTAQDKTTGKSQSISIENNSGRLTKEQIEKMVEDAKRFEKEDKANIDKSHAKNSFENDMYRVKGALDDVKDKDIDTSEVVSYLEECEQWSETLGADMAEVSEYETRSKKLNELFHPISSKMYEGGSGSNGMPDMNGMPGGMPGGMPDLSPEQMAQFQEMMSDPVKRAQMEEMVKNMSGGKSEPAVEELDELD